MFALRSVIYFILLFLTFESIALSAVLWSFFESTQNAIKQELVLADHRARDFTLALAKATELRLNQNGYAEINKTFFRYVEETEKDIEKFKIKEIRLYNPEGVILASSQESELKEVLEKRKPDVELTKETHFRKAMRMRKWEWPEVDSEAPKNKEVSFPELPKYIKPVVKFFPLSRVGDSMMYAPVYHETKLDVLGAVFVTYRKGNLTFLFENQFNLTKWMFVNYSLIAFVSTGLVWGIFFLFQYFTKKENASTTVIQEDPSEESLPLIQKKTISGVPTEVSELKEVQPIPEVVRKSHTEAIDAIYLG